MYSSMTASTATRINIKPKRQELVVYDGMRDATDSVPRQFLYGCTNNVTCDVMYVM